MPTLTPDETTRERRYKYTLTQLLSTVHDKVAHNRAKWGPQDAPTLLIAMMEELGETAQAHLHTIHEGGSVERVKSESLDLAALCFQLYLVVQETGP